MNTKISLKSLKLKKSTVRHLSFSTIPGEGLTPVVGGVAGDGFDDAAAGTKCSRGDSGCRL